MIQFIAWVVSLFCMVAIAFVFVFVVLKSGQREQYEPIVTKWYRIRKVYGLSLFILIAIVSVFTLRNLPYNQPVYGKGIEPIIVDVEAFQFGFDISQREFNVGDSVEFHVTTADVTHGFGIYDEAMNLIAQTQAMPDYTNTVYITFTKSGTYEILCLEYCGLAHHIMVDRVVVKE